MVIVVMGVAGSGKSTVGRALAARMAGTFIEGDEYHPLPNIEKMQSGIPLTDEDRREWLLRLAGEIERCRQADPTVATVISCSALKKEYRTRLREADRDLQIVYLTGSPDVIARRLADRIGHFMPPGMLASQLAVLEPPDEQESAIISDINRSVDEIVTEVCSILGGMQAAQ